MAKAIIDFERIKQWLIKRKLDRFEKKVEASIKKANELSELTKYRYLVLILNGRIIVEKRVKLKRAIERRYFKKGTTIRDLDKMSVHSTIIKTKKENGEGERKNNGSDTVCRAGQAGE